jgi:hypothetical protein
MANTVIRLGYLAISSGSGAGFEEYASLSAFPLIGQNEVIYVALDTNKTYRWSGSVYVEISPSEVISVNGEVGAVDLDKGDIGLGNVDNTSDADKPISTATQTELDLITNVNWTGDYNNGVTYTVGDGVMFNGASFRMIIAIGAAGYNPAAYPANWLQVTDYLSANDIGLGNVDNTSDADKPISDDTQNALDEKVAKAGDVMSGTLTVSVPAVGATNLGWQGVSSQSADSNQNSFYTIDGAGVQLLDPGISNSETTIYPDYVTLANNDLVAGTATSIVMQSGQISLQENTGIATVPMTPTLPEHVTTKKYVDDQDALKEDVANKSIDGTLASNSDTLYPSQKAVKTYVDALDDRIVPIEDRAEVLTVYAYENNAQVYADGQPGVRDTSALIRDGWYFKNSVAGQKINWYYFDGTSQGNVTLGDLKSSYAVMTFDAVFGSSSPIIAIYTIPTGTGDVIPGFAHSRIIYDGPMTPTPVAGKQYLVYAGENPPVHPQLPRINLALIPGSSIGDKLPTEQILTISLGSSSGAAVNQIQYMVETLGLFSDPVKHEMDLRIRTVPLNSSSKIDSTYLPSYVDDVLEFANLAAFPPTGDTGIIYVALDTNKCYRWSGSTYVEISPAPVTSVNGKTNAVTLNAIDIPFSPTATITSTDVQAAIEEVEANSVASTAAIFEDTKEPTGFINRTDSTISFVDGTRIFTISPTSTSFSFYIKGEKFTKTVAQNLTIPNLPGNHYIYFNTSGTLESTQVFNSDIIEKYAFISVIYWNTDTNTHTYFAEERHGITMDGATHSYLHTTFGSRYLSGLALQNFTIGDGSLDSHAQFSVDEGSIRDEDILLTSPVQSQIPILFRQGQLWRKKAADSFPLIYNDGVYYSGARIPFNEYVAGSWQLTAIDSNKFVLVHFFATNDKETPIVGIQGIAQYNDIPSARNAASTEITTLSGLPFAEFVAIGTVVFQTNTYANTPVARVRNINGANYVDFRGTQLYTPAGEATEHSLLSGLADDDHIQYHTDARGDIRYYTKSQVDSLIGGVSSAGDIDEKLFSISNSQAIPDNVHNFVFSNSVVRAFEALVSVEIVATASLYETVKISGIQKGSDWDITITSSGDVSGVTFSITSSGQIQYTSDNVAGFVSGIVKFRAITTSV